MSGHSQSEFRQKKRFTPFLTALALLVMLWVGYQLANTRTAWLQQDISNLEQTVAGLNQENHALTQQLNQQLAKQTVCNAELELVAKRIEAGGEKLLACEEKIGFYQYVMAPELSQGLFSVDIMSVKTPSPNEYTLELILLQPRQQKAVVTGELEIELIIAESDQPISLAKIDYRFKFFQKQMQSIVLPPDVTPVSLSFSTRVMQYKRFREQYSIQLSWSDIIAGKTGQQNQAGTG